jgi:protein phosphatase
MRQRLLEFSAAQAAYQGARANQEDSTRLWYPDGSNAANGQHRAVLAVLADGMGGHVSGEIASRLACEECVQHFSAEPGNVDNKIATVLNASNASLGKEIASNSTLSGMGCTLVAAYLDRDGVRWASAGDSALLLFRNERLYRLNENHSLGALLDKQAAANVISYEEAHNSPNRQSLRSALTGSPISIANIERSPHTMLPADWLILASDGLDTLSGDEIATIVGNSRNATPAELTRKLLDEVRRRGVPNQDNTSIVALRIHAGEKDARLQPRPRAAAGDGADDADDDAPDTEVTTHHYEEVGRVRHEDSMATTVLIPRQRHRGASRVGMVALAAAFVLAVAGSALLYGPVVDAIDSMWRTTPRSNARTEDANKPPAQDTTGSDAQENEQAVNPHLPPTKALKKKAKDNKDASARPESQGDKSRKDTAPRQEQKGAQGERVSEGPPKEPVKPEGNDKPVTQPSAGAATDKP